MFFILLTDILSLHLYKINMQINKDKGVFVFNVSTGKSDFYTLEARTEIDAWCVPPAPAIV